MVEASTKHTRDSSGSALSTTAPQMLEAIEGLPPEDHEVFCLVRNQELSQIEVAAVLGVSAKTWGRGLNRSLVLLADRLPNLSSAPWI